MTQLDILLGTSLATERQTVVARDAEHRRVARERATAAAGHQTHHGLRTRPGGWLPHGTGVPLTR